MQNLFVCVFVVLKSESLMHRGGKQTGNGIIRSGDVVKKMRCLWEIRSRTVLLKDTPLAIQSYVSCFSYNSEIYQDIVRCFSFFIWLTIKIQRFFKFHRLHINKDKLVTVLKH